MCDCSQARVAGLEALEGVKMQLSKRQQQALLVFLATNHSTRDASEWVLSELDDIELTLRDALLDEELSDVEPSSEDEDEEDVGGDENEEVTYCVEVPAEKLPMKERAFLLDEEDNGTEVVVELSDALDDDDDEQQLLLNVYKPSLNKKKREHVLCDEIVKLVVVDDFDSELNFARDTSDFYRMSLVIDTGEVLNLAVRYQSQLDAVLGSDTPCGEEAVVTLT